MPNDFNTSIIEEFRANGGRVGGWFEGARLLLLTTTGSRSGRQHTTPLGWLPDGDRVLVIGSAGGSPHHPAWYHNLRANPVGTVEDGIFTYQARATVLTGEERDRMFARAVEQDRGWADYQDNAGRILPVVALWGIPGTHRTDATSAGGGLKLIHSAFRRELELIRAEIAKSGPVLGAQLRVNCLTVCGGLHGHHTREDESMFPGVARSRPDLGPVLDRLRAEHEAIAALIARLEQVVGDPGGDRETLRAEVDKLTSELVSHLDYEEEHLIPVLDAAR